jgi:hypothetical protein
MLLSHLKVKFFLSTVCPLLLLFTHLYSFNASFACYSTCKRRETSAYTLPRPPFSHLLRLGLFPTLLLYGKPLPI